ncbi:hypothetical protein IHE45_17G064500 [Dioscorea alata]|uniref:Uncharacterized protein n=1 Tax=Dioscorea alata TaxID=55571 RepID=A0ACB7UCX9_DIOAL|nr:hypothetical protein IHE45_17G064500 [Dioscorea alata]
MVGDGEPSRPRTKSKHGRPPQRGLGVAELEKIRLEEHHKGSIASTTTASSPPPRSSSSSSFSSQRQSMAFNPNPVMLSPLSASSGVPMPWMDHAPESLHRRFRCRPNPGVWIFLCLFFGGLCLVVLVVIFSVSGVCL